MKFRHFLPVFIIITFFLSGCAGVQLAKNIFEFSVDPDKGLKAGTIVTVTVKAAEDTSRVNVFIDMFPDYKMALKYDASAKTWKRREMIPMMPAIPAGQYTAKVEVITKSGEKSYAEKVIATY